MFKNFLKLTYMLEEWKFIRFRGYILQCCGTICPNNLSHSVFCCYGLTRRRNVHTGKIFTSLNSMNEKSFELIKKKKGAFHNNLFIFKNYTGDVKERIRKRLARLYSLMSNLMIKNFVQIKILFSELLLLFLFFFLALFFYYLLNICITGYL